MLRTWGLIGACALLLSACGSMRAPPEPGKSSDIGAIDGFDASVRTKPNRCEVEVWELDDNLIVGHEPVYTKRCSPGSPSFSVTWRLPAPSPYTFSSNPPGIEFDASVGARCAPTGPKTYQCQLPRRVGSIYKYIVRVRNGDTLLPPLDPTILNN